MTIAQAFNEIAVAQGGTPSASGTITGAIDALNDALAGSDQEAASTIEGAVRLLGSHIGGGSSVTVEALTATENKTYTAPDGKAYSPVMVNVALPVGGLVKFFVNYEEPAVNSAASNDTGNIISISIGDNAIISGTSINDTQSAYISIAEGCTVALSAFSEEVAFYICGLNDQNEFTSVQEIDLASEYDSENASRTFTIPEVNSGKYLVMY